jgi:Pentapeptide repeats (8 copies)
MFDEIVEADFSNASFLRANFAEVSFKDVNFTEADLRFTEIRPDVDPPQFRRCRVDGALVSSRSNLPHIGRNIPETALSEIRTTRGERVPFLFVLRWDKPTAYDMDRSN